MVMKLPKILQAPPKLLPVVTEFKNYRYFLLEGGRGCVDGDTLIDTPAGGVKIKDFTGGYIYALNSLGVRVTCKASPSYIKGTAELFEVTLDDGRVIICTDKHKFFSPDGWICLHDIVGTLPEVLVHSSEKPQQSSSFHHQTISDTSLLMYALDVRHCLETILNLIYGYLKDCRLCGEQLLEEAETFQDIFPLLSDERGHSHDCLQMDDLELSRIYSLICQLSSRLAKYGNALMLEGRSLPEVGSCSDDKVSVLLSVSYQLSLLSHQNKDRWQLIQQLAKQFGHLSILKCQDESLGIALSTLTCNILDNPAYSCDNSFSTSCVTVSHDHHRTNCSFVKIKSVKSAGVTHFWDLSVPVFNNYMSNGIVSHNSGKSQFIARLILYACERGAYRVVCGRETQNSIEESVYTILKDLIGEYELDWTILSNEMRHNSSGATIRFKGFREQGAINIKGLEGVDILWVDEAQAISQVTLDILIPTIRKDKAKVLFSMNRHMRDDAVPNMLVGRPDCLHIQINYFENPYCPLNLKIEAENMKAKSERDYRHIWLGEPLSTADDFLFNYEKLHNSYSVIPAGDVYGRQRVMGIDFAAQGNDSCVATILDRQTNQHWELTEQISWDEADAMVSVGKIVNLIGTYKPDIAILDVGGMGHVVHNRLVEVGIDIKRFDGATTQGVDVLHYANARAEGYYILKDWFENGWLKLDRKHADVIKELEKIRMKFRSDGRRILESKIDMRKHNNYSPDHADSLMMAVYGAVKHLGRSNSLVESTNITRKAPTLRRR